jgi:hypothetical protein
MQQPITIGDIQRSLGVLRAAVLVVSLVEKYSLSKEAKNMQKLVISALYHMTRGTCPLADNYARAIVRLPQPYLIGFYPSFPQRKKQAINIQHT